MIEAAGYELSCQRIYELAGDIIGGLPALETPVDPRYPDDSPSCVWSTGVRWSRGMIVGLDEFPDDDTTWAGLVERYSGDLPPYRIFETERLSALGAIAVERADNDTVDEPGAMASVFIHISTIRVTVVGWTSQAVLEVATRVAEELFGE